MADRAQARQDMLHELVETDGLNDVQRINALTYYRDAGVAMEFALSDLSGSPYCPCCGLVLG